MAAWPTDEDGNEIGTSGLLGTWADGTGYAVAFCGVRSPSGSYDQHISEPWTPDKSSWFDVGRVKVDRTSRMRVYSDGISISYLAGESDRFTHWVESGRILTGTVPEDAGNPEQRIVLWRTGSEETITYEYTEKGYDHRMFPFELHKKLSKQKGTDAAVGACMRCGAAARGSCRNCGKRALFCGARCFDASAHHMECPRK